MSNKHTTQTTSTLLRNKLGVLAGRLQSSALPDGTKLNFDTMEEVVAEAAAILSKFYKYLSTPSFNPVEIRADAIPYPDVFNNHFSQILDDLTVLYAEFENLEGVVIGEFNYMATRLNRLSRKLKSASSQLADYVLFSSIPTKDVIFFTDSFNNLSRVESESPLLNKEQCEINQVEGIVTLPIDRTAQVPINIQSLPIINSNSNGVVGNNQEAEAVFHGTISDILDNNADTWFEYERVVSVDDGVALTLDITINMDKSRIVNFVRVNPNNFGTRTQVKILNIDTSLDGEEFISIKDDIPIADFTTEDEENVFTLAPSTSKYAGQGLYTFTPRKAKYVHLTFRQSTPYVIKTSSGANRFRYAIGIRDIDIQALPYKSSGEVVSTEYTVADEIRKLVLLSNQLPTAGTSSSLASITHAVSPDNGITWHQIRPLASSGTAGQQQTSAELLDFNGVSKNTVNTNTPVNSIRYRALLIRNTEAFSKDTADLAQAITNATELHPFPTQAPFRVNLSRSPISNTIRVIDPTFGSRGFDDSEYGIAIGTGSKKIVRIPFNISKVPVKSGGPNWIIDYEDPQTILIDGEEWTRGALTGTNKNYKLNFEENTIEFGDGTNGAAVPDKALISMRLDEERLAFQKGVEHIASLDYSTANDKKQSVITIYHPVKTKTVVLDKGKKIHHLDLFIQTSPSPSFSDATVFDTEVFTEEDLTGANKYYIDYTNGILMNYTRTKNSTDTTMTYTYQPITILAEDDWDFVDINGGLSNGITISNDVFQTFEADPETVASAVVYFNLGNLSVVPGTVIFSGTTTSFQKEVEFIDGRTELLENVRAEQQLDPITVSGTTILSIPFKVKVATGTNFRVNFTNSTVFSTEKTSYANVVAGGNGSFFVDRTAGTTGIIYLKTTTSYDDPGKVIYYYANTQANLAGRYSINYKTGEVYCYTATGTPSGATVSYQYTDIRAKYHIAREVNNDDWTYNDSEKTLSIADREILKSGRTFHTNNPSASSASRYYQITYRYMKNNRADVEELEPYFSPILKDYALKIYTKSRLV